jgi:hypothetical protein
LRLYFDKKYGSNDFKNPLFEAVRLSLPAACCLSACLLPAVYLPACLSWATQEQASNILPSQATLNGETAAEKNDMIILRAGSSDSLFSNNCERRGRATYTADQWVRDSQIAMSGYGGRGFFVHLYLNGLYWGMYNVAERPSDVQFWDSYLGGKKGNWCVCVCVRAYVCLCAALHE